MADRQLVVGSEQSAVGKRDRTEGKDGPACSAFRARNHRRQAASDSLAMVAFQGSCFLG